MSEAEIMMLIKQVLRQELTPIVMGALISNQSEILASIQRFSLESVRSDVRTIMPFGLASKPTPQMPTLIMPIGNEPSNLVTLGQYDQNRPPLADGDAALYDAHGNIIYLSAKGIQFGSESSSQNMVLGQALVTLLEQVLDAIAQHTHAGVGTPPTNASVFEQLKQSPVQDQTILSQKHFTE